VKTDKVERDEDERSQGILYSVFDPSFEKDRVYSLLALIP